MWECVGGLVVKVEDSLQGAIIEDKIFNDTMAV